MKGGKIIKKVKGKKIEYMVEEKSSGKTFSLKDYHISEEWEGKDCQFETKGVFVSKLLIDGKEISPATHKLNDFYSPEKLKLPRDTKTILQCNSQHIPENFLLRLQKYIRWEKKKDGEKPEFFRADRGKVKFQPIFAPYEVSEKYQKIIEKLEKRAEKIRRDFEKRGYISETLKASPLWRMTIGLGAASVYETSLTLHHIYGIPFIPGSAVKGLVRAYYITEFFSKNEAEAEKDTQFVKIFGKAGDDARAGSVIFLDAYPLRLPKLKVDVVNPHYKEYYEGKKPPADYLNPVPVPFLTLENTPFLFVLLARSEGERALNPEELKQLRENLKKALGEYGIGAKTALGYGVMEEIYT